MTNSRAASDTSDQNMSADDPHRAEAMPQSERVTINLTGKAVQALQRLQDLTGYNKTDCIDRKSVV